MGGSINGGTPKSSICRWRFPFETHHVGDIHQFRKPPNVQLRQKNLSCIASAIHLACAVNDQSTEQDEAEGERKNAVNIVAAYQSWGYV